MRPTDVCHPNELRAPAPRMFPARARHFRSGDAPWSLRLHTAWLGDRTFHDVRRPLRRIVIEHVFSFSVCLTTGWGSVGVFFPRCWCDRASDTPVATSSGSSSRLTHLRVCCNLAVWLCFWRCQTGRRMRRSPRPPSAPSRESRRLAMIRDAFYRQGPFVGSGGHYSPGPATRTPLLAMGEPLNDTLAPSWALRRSSPVFSGEADSRLPFARCVFRWFHPTTLAPC